MSGVEEADGGRQPMGARHYDLVHENNGIQEHFIAVFIV
jgi:hypothetical protein